MKARRLRARRVQPAAAWFEPPIASVVGPSAQLPGRRLTTAARLGSIPSLRSLAALVEVSRDASQGTPRDARLELPPAAVGVPVG